MPGWMNGSTEMTLNALLKGKSNRRHDSFAPAKLLRRARLDIRTSAREGELAVSSGGG